MAGSERGRIRRQFKEFEKEAIIEHVAKNRVKLGLDLTEFGDIRERIERAQGEAFQTIVDTLYSDNSVRRSLLTHLSSDPQKKRQSGYATLSLKLQVRERFMSLKRKADSDMEISEFMTLLLDKYENDN